MRWGKADAPFPADRRWPNCWPSTAASETEHRGHVGAAKAGQLSQLITLGLWNNPIGEDTKEELRERLARVENVSW